MSQKNVMMALYTLLSFFQMVGVSLQSQEFGPTCVIMSEIIVFVFFIHITIFVFVWRSRKFLAYPVDHELQVSFTSLKNKAL